jgi:hypothetical protein
MAKMFAFLLSSVDRRTDEGSSRLLVHRIIEAQCADWFCAVVRVVEFSYNDGLRIELFHRGLRSARPADVASEAEREPLVSPKYETANYRQWCNMLANYVCCNVRGYYITPYSTIGYADAHRELLLRPNGIRVAEADLPTLLTVVLPSIYTTCHVAPPDDPADLARRVAEGNAEALMTGGDLARALRAWLESIPPPPPKEEARTRGVKFVRYMRVKSQKWLGTCGHDWLICRPAKTVHGTAYVDVGCVSFMPLPVNRLSLRLTPVDTRDTPSVAELIEIHSDVYRPGDCYVANPFVATHPPAGNSTFPPAGQGSLQERDADLVAWHAEEAGDVPETTDKDDQAQAKERLRIRARLRKQEQRDRLRAGKPKRRYVRQNLPPVPVFAPEPAAGAAAGREEEEEEA